jgi:splicing factor U2AF 65 kDa subunit
MQINKEKRQAFAEFLTPEDATAALSFDGRSLNGSALRIRRPKEYVEMVVRFPSFPINVVAIICCLVFFHVDDL